MNHSNREERTQFANSSHQKFIESLATAWREGNYLLVRSVINNAIHDYMREQWRYDLSQALLETNHAQDFNDYMDEGANVNL